MKRSSVLSKEENVTSASKSQGLAKSRLVHLLVLALLACLAYANTFHGPFVFDDESSIVNNPVVKDLDKFLSGAGYAYNPRRFFGYLSFAINYAFGGLNTTGYHAVNLAIHILNGWAVYFLAFLTLRTPFFAKRRIAPFFALWFPFLSALLFLVHPVQTQAVTYIVQRLASLATLFYLSALICYGRARLLWEDRPGLRGGTVAFSLAAVLFAVLAMRTKEIAVTLPLVVLAYEVSFFGTLSRKKILSLVAVMLPLLAVVPLGMLGSGKPLGEILSDVNDLTRQSEVINRGDYLLTQFRVIVTYLRLLVLPVRQNLDYDYPVRHSLFAPDVFLSLLLLCALIGGATWLYLLSRRREGSAADSLALPWSRPAAFGILWFFITLSVESSVIPISDVIFEHRLYLPSVGAFFTIASLLPLLLPKASSRWCVAGTALVAVALTVATSQRNAVWGSEVSLWSDAVAKSPGKFRPHNNLGNAFNAQGKYDEALEEYQAAIKARPDFAELHNNIGTAFLKKGMLGQAEAAYREALRLDPAYVDATLNLGFVFEQKGDVEGAAAFYRKVLESNHDHAAAHNNLGVTLVKRGALEQGAAEFQASIACNPDYFDAYINLGETYLKLGRAAEANQQFGAVLNRNPGNARAYYNLGVLADLGGNADEAIRLYQKALELKPDYAEAAGNLGIDYGMKGMLDQAIDSFSLAVRINRYDADYHYNLAEAYAMKGWTDKAKEEKGIAEKLEAGGARLVAQTGYPRGKSSPSRAVTR